MDDDHLKITITWQGITIQLPITPEQQAMILQESLRLLHGDDRRDQKALDFLNDEEEHLRSLLLQYHQNRRVLEHQMAGFGANDVPLRIVNEMASVKQRIKETSSRIADVCRDRRALRFLAPDP